MDGETRTERLTPALAARYAATFDRAPRDSVPQGIHWCLNTPEARTDALGPDGHPARVDHLDLPRRMWASSEMIFHAPIALGAAVSRTSRVIDRQDKTGKAGRLLFVTVAHEIVADGEPAISERQAIVYREAAPAGGPPPPAPPPVEDREWDWTRSITPTEPLLFRYSALTFNSHRIHYDYPYVTLVEGYPGLIVQGPLMASLLLDLADRQLGPNALASFAFRGVSPAFAGRPLHLLGARDGHDITFAIADDDRRAIMIASATIG